MNDAGYFRPLWSGRFKDGIISRLHRVWAGIEVQIILFIKKRPLPAGNGRLHLNRSATLMLVNNAIDFFIPLEEDIFSNGEDLC